MRLRTFHAVLFAAIAVALTLLGSAVALRLTGDQLRAQIGGEMARAAGQMRLVLDRSVYGALRDIRILSSVAHTAAAAVSERDRSLAVANERLERRVEERKSAGHTVDIVGDGAEAVEAVRSETYDLVLMDVQMPGMDGLTATRAIRGLNGPARSIDILALTANALPGEIARFQEAGMNGRVGKPFKRTDLLVAVRRWSGGRQAAAA